MSVETTGAGLFAWFGNMKIKSRILLGFATVLALFAAVAGFSVWELSQISDHNARLTAVSGNMEIARNVQQAAKGTQEVSSNISGVTQASTQTGSAASQVLSSSAELAKQAETLRSEVNRFLAGIRAA